ncbi:MAG: methylmalonyl Co-A mutase-associated GTPase MeaB [Nannocystaceae bacterium]
MATRGAERGGGRMSAEVYVTGVLTQDRSTLSRAITLIESRRSDDRVLAREVMGRLLARGKQAHRIGITGVPGAGKSTLIDRLASGCLDAGQRVAVLAVDPSSGRTGGSLLGDKTRMARLAGHGRAFVRPSPSSGALGGVSFRTHEAISLCEAAGYDTVFVETVGVGQAEVAVVEMIDTFVLVTLPGAGDELQAVKRGVLELADVIVVNKAEDANRVAARSALRVHASAMHLLRPRTAGWQVPVYCCSAQQDVGVGEIASAVGDHRQLLEESGQWAAARCEQRASWMWRTIEGELLRSFRADPGIRGALEGIEMAVRGGDCSSDAGAAALLETFARSRART